MQVNRKIASVVEPASFSAKMAFRVRKKIYREFEAQIPPELPTTVLDVGASPDTDAEYSNFFELFYPYRERIIALSDQDASGLEQRFPGVKFMRGDGRRLPFADGSCDLVFSSAVLEHVGSREQQARFIAEACRVSRRYVFLTTPNRWHFLEFHTKIPFLHWLPKPWHRRVLRLLKLDYLASEANLNLLSTRELRTICRELGIPATVRHVRFWGWKSNILLIVEKRP